MLRRKQKNLLEEGESFENGILLRSNVHNEYCAVAIEEKEIVKVKWVPYKEILKKYIKTDCKESLYKIPVIFIFTVIFFLILFKDMVLAYQFLFLGTAFIKASLFYMNRIIEEKMEKIKYKKYHSAEHMIISAYNDLNRIPSIEEVWKYSRFSNTCGTNIVEITILSFIIAFVSMFIHNLLFFTIYFVASYSMLYIAYKCGLLNSLQRFTTDKPTEKEIRVAIEALKVWIEHEEKEV